MIDELLRKLAVAPVMGHFHPLVSLCLPADAEVVDSARKVAVAMDARESWFENPVLITEMDHAYSDRFLTMSIAETPTPEQINAGLIEHPQGAHRLLTNHQIADRIVSDALAQRYSCIALLLVDGLSYEDIRHWSEAHEPAFIDGPSITFTRGENGDVLKDVGFPAIVGSPPLAQRLHQAGISHARGYSYWDRAQNDVSGRLFDGMPLEKVDDMSQALRLLSKESFHGLYIQIVRIGTDSLAHGRREVSPQEVQATVAAVHDDLQTLIGMMQEREVRGAVYLTSDHGMLWKGQHQLQSVGSISGARPRYSRYDVDEDTPVTTMERSGAKFHLFNYPYIGATIRANDGGVHGGLSYWESIVPFVRIEVNT